MNRKQPTDRCLKELRCIKEIWNLAMWIGIAFPTFWAFVGCMIMLGMELDQFPLPYMGMISIICLPLAAISGWLTWRTQKQINRDLSRIHTPIFPLILGGEKE